MFALIIGVSRWKFKSVLAHFVRAGARDLQTSFQTPAFGQYCPSSNHSIQLVALSMLGFYYPTANLFEKGELFL